jgi:hypothetical protein
MEKELTEIKVTLAEIKVDLRHHIKRTELLENEVREWRSDIEPVQKHIGFINGLGKLLGILAVLSTAVAGTIALF